MSWVFLNPVQVTVKVNRCRREQQCQNLQEAGVMANHLQNVVGSRETIVAKNLREKVSNGKGQWLLFSATN